MEDNQVLTVRSKIMVTIITKPLDSYCNKDIWAITIFVLIAIVLYTKVISDYCKARDETLPFSFIVMDLYWEVLENHPLCLRNPRHVIQPSTGKVIKKKFNSLPKESKGRLSREIHSPISKSYSLTDRDERPVLKNPVQRAPSRLYRAASASDDIDPKAKYCCPNTCIGPEFIVRGRAPNIVVHMEGVKASCSKKVIVMLLNGQKLLFTCNPNTTTAGKLFEVLINTEGYEDNFTLGLATLLGGDFAFLPHDTKIHKVAPAGWRGDFKSRGVPAGSFTLYLRVKFFLPTLRGLRNWTMKHLMYLQLRRRLLEQQVQCNIDDLVTLGGLALQAEFGDYSDEEHGRCDYFLMEHYIPEAILLWRRDGQLLKTRMQLLHKERKGLDPGRAEEIYISLAQTLQDYSSHFYNAKWVYKHELPVLLAINSEGITLYRNFGNERSLHKFFEWKKIQLLSYSKDYLFIMPQNDNKGNNKPIKYKLQLDHKKSIYVFHLASFHHKISMTLRSDVNSLHSLTAEFGVPIRNNFEEENKFCCAEDNDYSNRRRLQVLVTPANGGYGSTHKNSEKRTVVLSQRDKMLQNECSVAPGFVNVEEHQNKENENPVNVRQEKEYCSDCKSDVNEWKAVQKSIDLTQVPKIKCSTLLGNTVNDLRNSNIPQRARVRMGTKIFSDLQREDCLVTQNQCKDIIKSQCKDVSQSQCKDVSSPITPTVFKQPNFSDIYVVNSSIRSSEEKFEIDFHETMSESLLEKFDTLSCQEERLLQIVKLRRDKYGNLGIQITEGSDGGIYIQSVVPGGPAAIVGTVNRGDQLIAVDGHNLLNLNYKEAMDLLKSSGEEVEILMSQFASDKTYKSTGEPEVENAFQMYTPDNKISIKQTYADNDNKLEVAEIRCGGVNLVSLMQPKSTCTTTVEDSYLNNIRYEMAPETASGQSEMLNTPIPTPVKPRTHIERLSSTPTHSNSNSIRAVCCVKQADDD